jgi:hypothetical protein
MGADLPMRRRWCRYCDFFNVQYRDLEVFFFVEGKNGKLWEEFSASTTFHLLVFSWHVDWLLVGKKHEFFALTVHKGLSLSDYTWGWMLNHNMKN